MLGTFANECKEYQVLDGKLDKLTLAINAFLDQQWTDLTTPKHPLTLPKLDVTVPTTSAPIGGKGGVPNTLVTIFDALHSQLNAVPLAGEPMEL